MSNTIIIDITGGLIQWIASSDPDLKIVVIDNEIQEDDIEIRATVPLNNDESVFHAHCCHPDIIMGEKEGTNFYNTVKKQLEK
ncbi:MAG: hypothetical protein E6Q68_02080 [Polynucleobacter sp.]|nr:MAG: hypothetical protein E6Q68_02080 [Polynucleobacter sp.]